MHEGKEIHNMTAGELSQLRWLRKEIEMSWQQLEALKEQGGKSPPALKSEIKKCIEIIAHKQMVCIDELQRLENYIESIEDELTRKLFIARYVDGYTWKIIADIIGPGYSKDLAKKRCQRYLLKNPE